MTEQQQQDERRRTRISLSTIRSLYFSVLILLLLVGAFIAPIAVERIRPNQDNVLFYATIYGFITTNIGMLVGKLMIDNQLEGQNKVLDDVQHKVNGHVERALNQLRELHRIEIAKLEGQIKEYRERDQLKKDA